MGTRRPKRSSEAAVKRWPARARIILRQDARWCARRTNRGRSSEDHAR
jgi:hypothetical protein